MSKQPKNKSEQALAYYKKYKDNKNLTEIARMLNNDFEGLFSTVESARSSLRYCLGSQGEKKREISERKRNEYVEEYKNRRTWSVPESFVEKKVPFHFPKHLKKLLVLNDIHIPYHDQNAVEIAIDYGISEGVDAVLLNGDILDFYQISEHEKNPANISIKMEVEIAKEFFLNLRSAFPTQHIYFIAGNHENRLKRFLAKNAKQIFDLDEFRLEKILCLDAFDIKNLQHKSIVYWGKLLIEHGDKLRGAGGVNPARTLILKFKRSVCCGHFHRSSMANGVVYQGDTYGAWSIGCLCELEPDYLEVNEWNHGFAIIHKDENGDFVFQNKQIVRGKVY